MITKHWKIALTITLVMALARIPFKGKTGEAASLITRAVTENYAKAACAQQKQPFLEEAGRRIVLGIDCPHDQHQFVFSLVTNLFQSHFGAGAKNGDGEKKPTSHHKYNAPKQHSAETAELSIN
jgi:hypothetical protein